MFFALNILHWWLLSLTGIRQKPRHEIGIPGQGRAYVRPAPMPGSHNHQPPLLIQLQVQTFRHPGPVGNGELQLTGGSFKRVLRHKSVIISANLYGALPFPMSKYIRPTQTINVSIRFIASAVNIYVF